MVNHHISPLRSESRLFATASFLCSTQHRFAFFVCAISATSQRCSEQCHSPRLVRLSLSRFVFPLRPDWPFSSLGCNPRLFTTRLACVCQITFEMPVQAILSSVSSTLGLSNLQLCALASVLVFAFLYWSLGYWLLPGIHHPKHTPFFGMWLTQLLQINKLHV